MSECVSVCTLEMSDIEILCCNNHPLKCHNYCKYHNVHLGGYKSAMKLKLQAYSIILYHMSRNLFFRVYMPYYLYDIADKIMVTILLY